MNLRDFLPKSFWARSVLIVFVPIVLIQLFSAYIFFDRHWEPVTRYLSSGLAHRIVTGYTLLEHNLEPDSSSSAEQKFAQLQPLLGLKIQKIAVPPSFDQRRYHPFQSRFERSLNALVKKPYVLRMRSENTYVWVKSKLGWLEFQFPTKWLLSRSSLWWGVWSLGSAILFFLLALFFLYRQLLPLRNLTRFAQKIDAGHKADTYRLRGALELRQIGATLQSAYEKLWHHAEETKAMLIGLSQDLKTPLSRMRLQLNLIPGSQAEKKVLFDDLHEMDQMITSYINFAETGQLGPSSKVSMLNLLMSVLKEVDPERRSAIQVSVPKNFFVHADVLSLKRSLAHLIKNACQHARKNIVVRVTEGAGVCHVFVADDGSGVSEKEQTHIFKPFVRLETGNSLKEVSTGMGLAIVSNFARLSGGHVEALRDKDLKGLQVHLSFPVSRAA